MLKADQPAKRTRILLLVASTMLALLAVGLLLSAAPAQGTGSVEGVVLDAAGPVAGARVRVRATDNLTFTDDLGRFWLGGVTAGQASEVTAWADGYYITSTVVTPSISGVALTLRPYHTSDNPQYAWTDPSPGASSGSCGNCHPMILPQWSGNAHGGAIANPRFYSLYNGSDLSGTVQVGPGYLPDFPGTAGNCASCHAPGAGLDGYLTTDMNAVRDVITAGIHCDYCHKIGGVYLNPADGSVYPNAPGTLSQRPLRPPPGDNIFFGPYDDVPDPDTYLPLISESQFCAPCHQFTFWGTPIYESYTEWLDSPYPDQAVTCQTCHMPPTGDVYFADPEAGGLAHPPEQIPSHLQPGATDVALLQETVTMALAIRQIPGQIQVTAVLTNTGAGHHVPTDHPGRHLILTVSAQNHQGQNLGLVAGSLVPDWGGPQQGLPGKIYAKVLRDVQSGAWPVVSYWKPTQVLADNRLAALGSDASMYTFSLPAPGQPVTVTAALRLRRAPWALMDAKGWSAPDIVMETVTATATAAPWLQIHLPLVTGGYQSFQK